MLPSRRRRASTVMSSIFACRCTVAKRFVFETTQQVAADAGARAAPARWRRPGRASRIASRASSARIPSPAPGTIDELPVGEGVLAVAEQDEVPVEQPLEEGPRLLDLVERVAGGARARRVDHLRHASPHRLVVAHCRLDVAEHEANACLELARAPPEPRWRLTSKCITDSRAGASRACSDPPDAAVGVALGPDHRVVRRA